MRKYLALFAACTMLTAMTSCVDINVNITSDDSETTSSASSEPTDASGSKDEKTSSASENSDKSTESSAENDSSESADTSSAETKKSSDTSDSGSSEADFTQFGYLAQRYYGTRHNRIPEYVDTFEEDDDTISIHLFDIFDNHATTYDWYYLDKKTGKGTNLIGDTIDLNEKPAEMWDPEVKQRKDIKDNDCFCGIKYVSWIMPEINEYHNTNVYLREMFLQNGIVDNYDFIGDLPEENWASTQLGEQLYIVIPRDPEANVKVTQYDFENDRELGNIYNSFNGSPFLLKCNYSDTSPDVKITITDNEGVHETFSPYISMRDGEPAADCDKVLILK